MLVKAFTLVAALCSGVISVPLPPGAVAPRSNGIEETRQVTQVADLLGDADTLRHSGVLPPLPIKRENAHGHADAANVEGKAAKQSKRQEEPEDTTLDFGFADLGGDVTIVGAEIEDPLAERRVLGQRKRQVWPPGDGSLADPAKVGVPEPKRESTDVDNVDAKAQVAGQSKRRQRPEVAPELPLAALNELLTEVTIQELLAEHGRLYVKREEVGGHAVAAD